MSKNTALELVDVGSLGLTSLDIGFNTKLEVLKNDSKPISLQVSGGSFNMNDVQRGIDVSKVAIKSGGVLDKTTGIVSEYVLGAPIVYTYDCGISKNGNETLEVSVVVPKPATLITVNKNLNKVYDGQKLSLTDADITLKSSTGALTYTWEMYEGANWVASDVSMNVGKYRVSVEVAEDATNASALSVVEFEITAPNSVPSQTDTTNAEVKGKTINTGVQDQTGFYLMLGTLSLIAMAFVVSKKKNRKRLKAS